MASKFLEFATRILEETQAAMTPEEIWKYGVDLGYDELIGSKGKTPIATLGATLYVDLRDNPNSRLIKVGSRPTKFSLSDSIATSFSGVQSQVSEVAQVRKPQRRFTFQEYQLHPFLTYYGFNYLNSFLKTIHHQASKKREFGEWVHPDVVGCYFPYLDWDKEVVETSKTLGDNAVKLYSFEIKRELSIANLREAFFQAVSNSSWANEGYLAAATISANNDFRDELRRLSSSFGIGVIHLDIEDPDASNILYPAKTKEKVDWETVNKLAGMCKEFKEFLRRVRLDFDSSDIRKEWFDQILDKDRLIDSIRVTHN